MELMHTLRCGALNAKVATVGAELRSLQTDGSTELIWHGDPNWWGYSAPLLFPIVGRLEEDTIEHDGRKIRLASHGFARNLPFSLADVTDSSISFLLEASSETLSNYPFQFRLSVRYELSAHELKQSVVVSNAGMIPMPASFGFHPALKWPAFGNNRANHKVKLNCPERGSVFRVNESGRLEKAVIDLGVRSDEVVLDDVMFAKGAIVFDPVSSSELIYVDDRGPIVGFQWAGCNQLGLWSLPGAPFVCVEPWHGHPSPIDFHGSLVDKPGGFIVMPSEQRAFTLVIRPFARD